MKNNIWGIALVGVVAVMLGSGCSAVSKKSQVDSLSGSDLQAHARAVLSQKELSRFSVPYEINEELEAMAWEAVDRRLSDVDNAKRIAVFLLKEKEGLGISYQRSTNLCALDVYEHRQANCISYTNLFVGMARSVGLNVNYAEVTQVDSIKKVGGTVVYNSHMAAVVFEGPKPYIIDFSLRRYPQYHSWRTVSDVEAVASFYNNVGSQHYLTAKTVEDYRDAETYFRMSMKLDPTFAQAYNNMGVLYMRYNNIPAAEEMYRTALRVKPGYFAPYANLANIFTARGENDRAVSLLRDAVRAMPENYYAYVSLARLLSDQSAYSDAEEVLKRAIAGDKTFVEARHELGRLYLRQGRSADAREQFALALKFQPDDRIALTKMDLIERLASENAGRDDNF